MCWDMPEKNDKKLLNEIKRLSITILNAYEPIAVLTHYDADGLASGGAMARFLSKSDKLFVIRSTHSLSEDILNSFFSIRAKTYIIQDMGSGDINLIYSIWRNSGGRNLIIIDHHKVLEQAPKDNRVFVLNPELFGFDGGKIGSTAVLVGLIGYYGMSEKDPYFLEIGVVGAFGDMQIQNGVLGINEFMLKLAESKGVVKRDKEFIFFTLNRLPIYKAIVSNLMPYIPGYTYREDVGLNIVRKAGIKIRDRKGDYITIADITKEEKTKLLEIITNYIASLGLEDLDTSSFITDIFYLPIESDPHLYTTQDFSNLLSSCGRMDREEIGISIASGVRGKILNIGKSIFEERKRTLARYLENAEKIIKVYDGILCLIDLRTTEFSVKFSGTISTIFSRSLKFGDKIIVVLALDDADEIKLSCRAPRELVDKGLDLSRIMRKLAEKHGGRGGGHNIAAGASLPAKSGLNIVEDIRKMIKDAVNKI